MRIVSLATLALAFATIAAAAPAAKLSMKAARGIALKAAPGKLVSGEYENEGGSWRYSFDIRQGNRIHEIGVDANSGRIVESKYEALGSKD